MSEFAMVDGERMEVRDGVLVVRPERRCGVCGSENVRHGVAAKDGGTHLLCDEDFRAICAGIAADYVWERAMAGARP